MLLELVRVERRHGSVVGHLEADRVRDLDSRVLEVRDDEPRELWEIRGDDPDPPRAEGAQPVDERSGGRDDGRRCMLSLEDRLDLRLAPRSGCPGPAP